MGSFIQAHDYKKLLYQSTDSVMATGGDDRLHIDKITGVSKYFTAPTPQHDIILRSSCTSSFPSEKAFAAVGVFHRLLLQALEDNTFDSTFEKLTNQVRADISLAFDRHNKNPYIILTPSGTDAEMVPALMALLRAKQYEKKIKNSRVFNRVLNIVLAVGEVGSGTVSACGLRYFNQYLPDGLRALEKTLLHGVQEQDIIALPIPARNTETGVTTSIVQLEKSLEKIITEAIEEKDQHIVLHAVHCSKTGMGIPSFEFMKNMKKKYQEKIVAVVDMAQMRCSDQAVSAYLHENICVLITGSKFFEGPAFSGALLIPEQEIFQFNTMQEDELPLGIKSYITQYDVDARLTTLRSMLSPEKNIGLLLRWAGAVHMIKSFYQIPEFLRATSALQWVSGVKLLIEKTAHVHELSGQTAQFSLAQDWALLGLTNTIISVTVTPGKHPDKHDEHDVRDTRDIKEETFLSYTDLKKVHAWMSQDITNLLPECATEQEIIIAKKRCMIGQPVPIVDGKESLAIVRIALGASMLVGLQDTGTFSVQKLLDDDRIVLEKLSLIGKYFYSLHDRNRNHNRN